MASSTTKRELVITLTLNDAEASYIRILCQNDLTGGEDEKMRHIRKTLFNVLSGSLSLEANEIVIRGN